ncbi:unnamed protein product [Clonostachys rhizophaga]|uniref:Uncharacterized protein n=1 Tax=Clonostachys rhizophaga TaxID=160324 RepID=A0A9N9V2Z4_9HYPO|nr:unnamed protein product [Clonostachys rhizophaga]
MRPVGSPLPPTSSLPPLRTLESSTEEQVFSALQGLSALYCPFAFPFDGASDCHRKALSVADTLVDSGYVSATEGDEDDDREDRLAALRADNFERSHAERWLTGFIARSEMLECFTSEDSRQRAIDQASWVLESFFASTADQDQQMQEELADYAREFSFPVTKDDSHGPVTVDIRLNDGLAGMDSSQPDDVGLQSWGASIVVSKLLCQEPARFGLTTSSLGASPRIIELGAGTGLVGLVMAKLLPHLGISDPTVIATDYHPAVLENLRSNIKTNFPRLGEARIEAALLDWASPNLEHPLDAPADMLIATDVVYAPEHAAWLRDCSTEILGPDGTLWLVATVRQNGRFEGVSETVEAAFNAIDRPAGKDGRRLTIMHAERLEKSNGIGRGDESGYRLFRIGWA